MIDLSPFLTAIEQRLAQATPGEWNQLPRMKDGRLDSSAPVIGIVAKYQSRIHAYAVSDGDSEFIVHAPTDLARCVRLLRVVEPLVEAAIVLNSKRQYGSDTNQAVTLDFKDLKETLTAWASAVEGLGKEGG